MSGHRQSADAPHSQGHRRLRWRDGAVTDITEYMPQWKDDESLRIAAYHVKWVRAVQTPNASRMPDFLREEQPLETLMQVLLRSHATHPVYLQMMSDVGVASRVRAQLDTITQEGYSMVQDAIDQPNSEWLQEEMMDYGRRGMTVIRAGVYRTSPRGVLHAEANELVQRVQRAPMNSQLDFIVDVDNWWSDATSLWGKTQTMHLNATGTGVTQFLTVFVARLDPSMQDRALTYYNAILHSYMNMPEDRRPSSIRKALSDLNAQSMSICPERPDHMYLFKHPANTDDVEPRMAVQSAQMLMADEEGPRSSIRFLTNPDDLHVIQACGIGISHWRTLIARLIGGYSRLQFTPVSNGLFIATPTSPAGLHAVDVAKDQDRQEGGSQWSEHEDVLAVTRAGGQRSGRTDANFTRTSQVKSEGNDGEASKRVRWDPQAADKIMRAAADTQAAMKADMGRLESKIESRAATLEERINKEVSRMERGMDKMSRRSMDEYAQFLRTSEKLLQNVATHATDLKQATAMKDTAARVAAKARSIETQENAPTLLADTASSDAIPVQVAAAQVSGRQRGRTIDENGMKLSHVPPNNFDEFSDQVKGMYRYRDNVTDKAGFEAIAKRVCMNCPRDAFNMPHEELRCTLTYATQQSAEKNIGKARAVRNQQRVADNIERLRNGQPASTYSAMVALAATMDEAAHLAGEDGGYEDACVQIAAMLPVPVYPDTEAELFVSLAEHTATIAPCCLPCPNVGGL